MTIPVVRSEYKNGSSANPKTIAHRMINFHNAPTQLFYPNNIMPDCRKYMHQLIINTRFTTIKKIQPENASKSNRKKKMFF